MGIPDALVLQRLAHRAQIANGQMDGEGGAGAAQRLEILRVRHGRAAHGCARKNHGL